VDQGRFMRYVRFGAAFLFSTEGARGLRT
jgi:hypothetical protein